MQRYVFFNTLGRGTFGIVYRAYDKHLHQDVAIKQIAKSGSHTSREADILSLLSSSSHCIHILDVFFAFTHQLCEFIVCEYLPFTLKDFIYRTPLSKSSPLYNNHVKNITKQILQGLASIHAVQVVHRDLKPENILLNDLKNPQIVKICDFGSAKLLDELNNNPYVVSSFYRAPELVFGSVDYGTGVDLWSVGCVIVEMFLQRPLFACGTDSDLFVTQINMLGKPGEEDVKRFAEVSTIDFEDLMEAVRRSSRGTERKEGLGAVPKDFEELVLGLLKWDPKKRLSANDAILLKCFG
jgi:serine/threonine protein kinase